MESQITTRNKKNIYIYILQDKIANISLNSFKSNIAHLMILFNCRNYVVTESDGEYKWCSIKKAIVNLVL